jgi:hypothetical protein
LVDAFYERVRRVERSAIFNGPSATSHHLDKLADFWHSVMFGGGRYPGGLMMRHFMHRDRIKPEHFERWLALWRTTTAERMPRKWRKCQDVPGGSGKPEAGPVLSGGRHAPGKRRQVKPVARASLVKTCSAAAI